MTNRSEYNREWRKRNGVHTGKKRKDGTLLPGISRQKKRWRQKYPEKARAHLKVWQALQSGKLQKLPCQICGDLNVHAHHHNYESPLDVQSLCPAHHRQIHAAESVG